MTSPVIDMVERVIQPNGAFRQSPYVDAAQYSLLTGLPVTLDGSFEYAPAADTAWRPSWASGKTQYALLELARLGRISGNLRALISGDHGAEQIVAMIDFLLLWQHISVLHGQRFPVEDVHFTALRRGNEPRETSNSLLAALEDALAQRATIADRSGDGVEPVRTVARWAGQADWIDRDGLDELSRSHQSFDLILANAPVDEAPKQISDLLAPGGSLVMVVPGTREEGRALSTWRRKTVLADPELHSLGPCGQEFGNQLPACCDSCWPVRSERFDPPAHLSSGQHWAETSGDSDFALQTHSSWSYTLIGRDATPSNLHQAQNQPGPGTSDDHPGSETLRFIGAFRGSRPEPAMGIQPTPSDGDFLIKVCPADTGGVPAAVRCGPDMLAPDLRFGDRFELSVMSRESRGSGELLHTSSPEIRPVVPEDGSATSGFIPTPEADELDRVSDAMDEIAFRLFGFQELREFQHVILSRVLAGYSILGIAATGGGKSECFILPAMISPGLTIVVSPLKSLMMDQYQERICRRYGLGERVTWINGDLDGREQRRRLDRAARGFYKLIYLTPEQLEKQTTIEKLREADARVGLRYMAIDEAHCISQWGHDFRPSYLNTLRRMADADLNPVRVALTATASPAVRADICQELGLENHPLAEGGDVYIYSSNRPELNLITRVINTRAGKVDAIVRELQPFGAGANGDGDPGSAIVFMPWTQHKGNPPTSPDEVSPHVSSMASYLEQQLETPVSIYHGGMDREEQRAGFIQSRMDVPVELGDVSDRQRGAEQQAFIRSERRIMVATKGFGMGIDKPDIRTVIHATPPANLEAYVQEAGRAGRDGAPSNVVLYYSPEGIDTGHHLADYTIQRSFLERKRIRRSDVQAIARYLYQRYRDGDRALNVAAEDVRDAVVQYCIQRNYPQIEFGNRRENKTESPEHAQILDRGYEYQQWSEYLDRLIGELHAFASLAEGSGHGSFFASAGKYPRHRDPAFRAMTLDEQREQFGARFRAFPWKANARAKDAGRERPSLDDWFGRDEVVRPVGWSVTLGTAFESQERLVAFVTAFCDAHEQRYRNSWDSYTRLLTEYLGLKPDGTTNPAAQPECLRSVMLGYLKTNEIVQDGNCRSCSNCVPDEQFDRYTLDERRDAVVRIDDDIQEMLKDLEASADTLPDAAALDRLTSVLRRNTESSRALQRYIAGWTARILDEEPQHVAIRWLRLDMIMADASSTFPVDEITSHLQSLSHAVGDSDLPRLWAVTEYHRERGELQRSREFVEVQWRLAHRLGRHEEEASALSRLSELTGDALHSPVDETRWIFERMRDLHGPGSPLPDSERFFFAQEQLARSSASQSEAQSNYNALRRRWEWNEVLEELRILELPRYPRIDAIFGLLRVWIEQHREDPPRIAQALDDYFSGAASAVIEHADPGVLRWMVDLIGAETLCGTPKLFERLTTRLLMDVGELDEPLIDLLRAKLTRDSSLPPALSSSMVRMIASETGPESAPGQLASLLELDRIDPEKLAISLAAELAEIGETGLARWLRVFPVELHEQSPELARQVLNAVRRPVSDPELRDRVTAIANSALWRGVPSDSIHDHWMRLNRQDTGALGEYIQDCLEADPPEVNRSELAFTRLLEHTDLRELGGFLKWAERSEVVRVSGRISDAARLFSLIVDWAEHRKAEERSGRADPPALRSEFETWADEHTIEGIQEMDPEDYTRILELCLNRMSRRKS